MAEHDHEMYVHCGKCSRNLPRGRSPKSHSRLEVLIVPPNTIEIHCMRHGFIVDFLLDPASLPELICADCSAAKSDPNNLT